MISTVASAATGAEKGSEGVSSWLCKRDEDIEKLEAFAGRTCSKSKLMTKRLDRWITASIYIKAERRHMDLDQIRKDTLTRSIRA